MHKLAKAASDSSPVVRNEISRVKILFVCTGNICRSPYAEQLLVDRLGAAAQDFRIASAGTHAVVGRGMDPEVRNLLGKGEDITGNFTSRQMNRQLLESADVILTMTRDQRTQVLQTAPNQLAKTFTLLQLARIFKGSNSTTMGTHLKIGTTSEYWTAGVAHAAKNRADYHASAEADNVVDPYRRGPAVFDRMARQIGPAINSLVEWNLSSR